MAWDECLNVSFFGTLVRTLQELGVGINFVVSAALVPLGVQTYRDGDVVLLVARVQLPPEPQHGVGLVLVTGQQDVILRLIQDRLPIVAVNWNVSVLEWEKCFELLHKFYTIETGP